MHYFKTAALAALTCVALAGCANGRVIQLSESVATGPRVIALDAPNAPWVAMLQQHLKAKGFKVLRWASVRHVTERTSDTRVEDYRQAEARYVLVVQGSAAYDWGHRCFGGGFQFDNITADLVDIESNETLSNISGSGYSEGCPPLSGKIFTNIAKMVDAAWVTR